MAQSYLLLSGYIGTYIPRCVNLIIKDLAAEQTQSRRQVAELLGDETIMKSEDMTAAVSRVDNLVS